MKERWLSTSTFVSLGICAALVSYLLTILHLGEDSTHLATLKSDRSSSAICVELSSILPNSTHYNGEAIYKQTTNSYWSQNAAEVVPSCILRPANKDELSKAVTLLKSRWNSSNGDTSMIHFAVKSGGHSPERGFATSDQGVLIDMNRFSEVTISKDHQSVFIGAGARWNDVYAKLDQHSLAVAGGRNANVGVGGFILGGGLSLFSPKHGMACDNVIEYQIILANGSIVHVSSSQHSDLWRALQGGSGNFGILTRIRMSTFSSGDILAGYKFFTSWQSSKAITAFHEFNQILNFDENAAGPLLAFVYVQPVGLHLIACYLAYTKHSEGWPLVLKPFQSIRHVWSTIKTQSITSATQELHRVAPLGKRQFQATTTVKNDLDTLLQLKAMYRRKLKEARYIKGGTWSFVFQPLSPSMMQKGQSNILGLRERNIKDTLVIVFVSVSWKYRKDDKLVEQLSREMISESEEIARSRGTDDPYKYLNYAASGQDPFHSYGERKRLFLQEMSKKYDPDGFYQRVKQGGFKLDL